MNNKQIYEIAFLYDFKASFVLHDIKDICVQKF